MKKQLLILLSFIFCMISASINANDAQKRITPDMVTIHNYEQFIAQLERDLPKGTPVEDIKKYLSENKIGYSDVPEEDCLYAMLKKIDSLFFIYTTDLWLRIYVSQESGLLKIKHDLIHTAI